MKLIKVLLVIFMVSAVSLIGLDLLKSRGNINIEVIERKEEAFQTSKDLNAKKIVYLNNGSMDDWQYTQLFFKRDIMKISTNSSFLITAKKGYELIAFDQDDNAIGIVVDIFIDDGAVGDINADFSIDNYFYILAKKIGK